MFKLTGLFPSARPTCVCDFDYRSVLAGKALQRFIKNMIDLLGIWQIKA